MIVVAMVIMRVRLVARGVDKAGVFLDRRRAMRMTVIVMLDHVAARATRMRADERDDRRDDGAEQRQEDNCLYHNTFLLRMILPENRLPLFRIMRPLALHQI